MKLLYVGRLDKEKGIQNLLIAITNIIQQDKKITLDIYGSGQYTQDCIALSKKRPNNIHYHGRKHKKKIKEIWSEFDFFIMPSTFLETFGLTACESLLAGVPVIGHKKGGLVPFIDGKLDIGNYAGDNEAKKIENTLLYIQKANIKKDNFKEHISNIKKTYTIKKRYKQIHPYTKNKNIMIVSDFINYNGGGVETHINDIQQIYLNHKKKCILFGYQAPTLLPKIQKIAMMVLSLINTIDSLHIYYKLKKNNIGILRIHSISRVIGRLPLRLNNHIEQIITHHELGLFHPFPSMVTEIKQIPQARSLKSFIKAGETNNILKKILIIGKYIQIWLIHKQLQNNTKTHIVPSERMVDIIKRRHPQAEVIHIPHFVKF